MANDELVCSSCGNLLSECRDPSIDWHGHESVCWATATRDWWMRRLQDEHKDATPGPEALHPLDGVAVWASRIPPEGD